MTTIAKTSAEWDDETIQRSHETAHFLLARMLRMARQLGDDPGDVAYALFLHLIGELVTDGHEAKDLMAQVQDIATQFTPEPSETP
jgi:hypothetical protein